MMQIKERKVKAQVKDLVLEFNEMYRLNENGEEIFDRDIWVQNDINLYNIYKKEKGLLTTHEIIDLRKKYDLTQKEFAKVLGLGEVSIARFENGSIQTSAVDTTIRTAQDPKRFKLNALKNKDKIDQKLFQRLMIIIDQRIQDECHRIADISVDTMKSYAFKTSSVKEVAETVISVYNNEVFNNLYQYVEASDMAEEELQSSFITHLKLQKLLYFIQGISLSLYDKPAFTEKIINWSYGPVVREIYNNYHCHGKTPISMIDKKEIKLSKGLEALIKEVVNSYGQRRAENLIDLSHREEPWLMSKRNQEITHESLKRYFTRIYL